ncbi:unnamed protein product [Chondrus crispus]|uniref:Uncharacterized protein n=1 Tax=Chondrus crispus TaxID=2769 RepID=R7QMI9_CHOCR|nr:unnamed protein product [Chondrus crispus]CDF39314.1 unnamed protein product [Chondrus crispus]|eukprot:XP_005719225.1 unnamed protein product [Chondrus crispus]
MKTPKRKSNSTSQWFRHEVKRFNDAACTSDCKSRWGSSTEYSEYPKLLRATCAISNQSIESKLGINNDKASWVSKANKSFSRSCSVQTDDTADDLEHSSAAAPLNLTFSSVYQRYSSNGHGRAGRRRTGFDDVRRRYVPKSKAALCQ